MDAKIGSLFESIGNFFSGGDQIPWCDRDVIAGCEREVAEASNGDSEERKNESIMRLSWALVHSREKEDVQRGIAMLETCRLVENNYRTIDFPFEPVDGADHTGPFEFVTEVVLDLDDFFTYIRSWSAYQTANEKGVELLGEDVVEKFKLACGEDGQKIAKFPIYL